ncbi:Bardet-Biedl syndrome 12 protein, partial [Huso huso]
IPGSGCKVLYKGRHIGLQQLTALAEAGRTFLGPTKFYKFVMDLSSCEAALTCSSFRLLENLDLSSAVGQLLNETVQAHQKVFNTGTTSLMFLAGAWSAAVLECLHQGIPIPVIVAVMSAGLESCTEFCKGCAVPIEDIVRKTNCDQGKQAEVCLTMSPNHLTHTQKGSCLQQGQLQSITRSTISALPTLSQSTAVKDECLGLQLKVFTQSLSTRSSIGERTTKTKIKLTHSRHFNSKNANSDEQLLSSNLQQVSLSTGHHGDVNITHLAVGLSHGCSYGMNLVIEAYRLQAQNTRKRDYSLRAGPSFDVSKIVTCVLPGLCEEQSCVTPGFVTLVSIEQAALANHFKDQNLRVVLINGDLSERYRHLGFNGSSNIKNITESPDVSGSSLENEWAHDALTALLSLKVNLVLVMGMACPRLMETCVKHNILIVQWGKPNVLKDFAETTGAVAVAYITQVNEYCVGSGACVSLWRTLGGTKAESANKVAISVTGNATSLVTAVITSSVICKLQAMEDQFWTCAHRLNHALKEKTVFPGAGRVEMLCLRYIQKIIEEDHVTMCNLDDDDHTSSLWMTEPVSQYRGIILQLMSDGWKEYLATLMCNSTMCTTQLEAWTVINQCLGNMRDGVSLPPVSTAHLFNCSYSEPASEKRGDMDVYDNVTVKVEAWRRALDVVLLVLQTDTEIVTGYSTGEAEELPNELVLL